MRQAVHTNGDHQTPPLRIASNNQASANELKHLVDTAWCFTSSALWNNSEFSSREIQQAKNSIESLLSTGNRKKAFIDFCQRVLLARHYIIKHPGKYIPLPSAWLDKENKFGFFGTKAWMDRVNNMRQSLPAYKQEIKAMAEAVLELSQEPSAGNYNYWRSYFIDHRSPGLLQLFQLNAVHQIYN